MIELLKKQWFVVLIALIFTSFALYYAIDTNQGKLAGKSVDGNDVVATIGKQNITADDVYDGLEDAMGGSVAAVYYTRYVADQSVETTDKLKEEAKQNAENYRSYAENQYGEKADAMVENSLKQLNYETLEDYFLIEAKKAQMLDKYYEKHLDELFKPVFEEKNGRILAHILIKMEDSENPTEAELEKVKAVEKALADGTSFYDVAKTYSDDTGSATLGGRLGYSDDDTSYVKEFKEMGSTLKKDEVSDWVKVKSTNYSGWHKILCVADSYEDIIKDKDAKDSIYTAIESANPNIANEVLWEAGKKLDIKFNDKQLKKALMKTLGIED